MRRAALLPICLLSMAAPATADAQALSVDEERRVGEIFADLDVPGSPGASVAIVRRGEIVYSRGFGEAQIEHAVPVTPATIFHVASVSKQFTAAAVMLLEADGKLRLDDDVRTHMPDLPDMGATVTIRQLLHHTSGVRDQWELLAMAGWRLDDVITKEHVRRLLRKQRELNFEPGSEYLYSNMGFSLAADLVERVSGEPFADFLQERVFGPLRMERTHVHDDHEHVVVGRAYSYRGNGDDGWENAVLSYANHGATSLFTSAEDLVRWLDNFRHGRVLGTEALSRMQERGVLTSGDTIGYGLGLAVGTYRGAKLVGHGGSDAGFRSDVAWFPEHELGIVVLSNLASANPGGRTRRIADIVLADELAPQEPSDEPPSAADPEPSDAGPPLEQYVGTYYSPEIETVYELRLADDALAAYHLRHGDIELERAEADIFRGGMWFFRRVAFSRDAQGAVDGFRLTGNRVRNLRFVKLTRPLPR